MACTHLLQIFQEEHKTEIEAHFKQVDLFLSGLMGVGWRTWKIHLEPGEEGPRPEAAVWI